MKDVWARKRAEKERLAKTSTISNNNIATAANRIPDAQAPVRLDGPPAYRFIPRRAVKAVVKTTYSDGSTSKEVNTFNPNNGY